MEYTLETLAPTRVKPTPLSRLQALVPDSNSPMYNIGLVAIADPIAYDKHIEKSEFFRKCHRNVAPAFYKKIYVDRAVCSAYRLYPDDSDYSEDERQSAEDKYILDATYDELLKYHLFQTCPFAKMVSDFNARLQGVSICISPKDMDYQKLLELTSKIKRCKNITDGYYFIEFQTVNGIRPHIHMYVEPLDKTCKTRNRIASFIKSIFRKYKTNIMVHKISDWRSIGKAYLLKKPDLKNEDQILRKKYDIPTIIKFY